MLGSLEVNGVKPIAQYDFTKMSLAALWQQFISGYIWDRNTIINEELQYYIDHANNMQTAIHQPIKLDQEGLTITAKKRNGTNADFAGQSYLSGLISSHGKETHIPATSEGPRRVSALLSLPEGAGVWPAWWLLPEFERWPEGIDILPEIDIMEYIGQPGRYYSTVHSRHGGSVLNQDQYTHNCPGVSLQGYHWYHFERDSDHIKIGFDDQWTNILPTPVDLQGPLHMNLNLAVGGSWAGDPNLDQYQLKCTRIIITEPPSDDLDSTISVPPPGSLFPPVDIPTDHPNHDIIRRLETLKEQQVAGLCAPIDDRISDLLE